MAWFRVQGKLAARGPPANANDQDVELFPMTQGRYVAYRDMMVSKLVAPQASTLAHACGVAGGVALVYAARAVAGHWERWARGRAPHALRVLAARPLQDLGPADLAAHAALIAAVCAAVWLDTIWTAAAAGSGSRQR